MARKRVKNYDYIKRSDISVLKATIDGKVLDVDPKTILSGTYVAGKIKPTTAKIRVAKVDPEKLRIKMLNMYEQVAEKKYKADFEKYVTVADIKKFVECGMTEEMVMAFYCGIQSIMEIKADNEFAYKRIGGIFDFRTDEDGKYIKNYIKRGLANCENNVFELGFKYPSFDWKKVGMKIPKTDIIETLPYDFFGKERKTVLRIETFNVKTNFKVLAIKAIADIESGNKKPRSGKEELFDPKTTMDLNNGYLAIVSRNGKELFALAKKLLSQEKSYVKDFEWLVQNKTGGAEDLIEKNYKFANGGNINAEIDGLKKGDTITIEYGSSVKKDNKVTLKVRSRNKVRKGTIDKITFDNTNNPSGVKFYAYNRGKGWSFAMGDMGISNVKIVSTYAEGGSIETITRLNGNRQEYTLPLPKISILTSEINDTALTWIEDNTGLKFRKTAWAYEAQPQKSEQIVKLLTMYGFVTQFHNNATNKNVLFLKFFKDEFMQYAKGGNLNREKLVVFYGGGERQVFSEKTFNTIKEDLFEKNPKGIMRLSDTDLEKKYNQAANFEKFKKSPKYNKNLSGEELWFEFIKFPNSLSKGGNLAQRGLHKATSTGDSIADWAFNFDPKKRYAKGGVTEHGLKVGDTITDDLFWENRVVVKDKGGKRIVIDLESGKRGVKYSNGGGIEDVDFMAAARTSARDSIDWSEELRNFAGENYESLSELEKESIIADMKSNWDFQHSFAKGGNVKRTEINEDGSNIPEPLYEIFGEWDEDNDPYKEAERLRIKANEIGYDFDYDLSGAPTEFWEVQKANVGALLMAEKAKGLAPKSFDAADTKIANRLSKKSFAQRMSETGNEEYDRDAYQANTEFAKGGGVGDTLLSKIKIGNIIPTNQGNFEIIGFEEDTTKLDIYDGGFSYFKVKDENGQIKYIKISREKNPKMFLNHGSLMSASWANAKRIFAKGGKLDETKYIPRDEIIKVELKNGKVIVNSWNNPIYSGLRIGKGISERQEMEQQGQLAMFKRGGKMPKYAQYVSQRDIAKVYLYDEDEPTEISGRDLVGGIYYDNEKAAKLIEMARERGLIK